MKKKFVSFVAVACMAGAVAAGPANASTTAPPAIPNLSNVAALCQQVKQPSLQAACNQGAATLQNCSTQTSIKGVAACVSSAARSLNLSRVRLPADISRLISQFTGSGGIKLPNIGGLGGIKLPGGIDLSKLLGGFRG
jgi:hypothetical protein